VWGRWGTRGASRDRGMAAANDATRTGWHVRRSVPRTTSPRAATDPLVCCTPLPLEGSPLSALRLAASTARRAARTVLSPVLPKPVGLEPYRDLAAEYRVHDLVERDGQVPLVWWPNQPNFGDLLSPWLFEKMTGKPVVRARRDEVAYVSIGSVLKRVTPGALVWGTGSFGNEQDPQIELDATYFAVRGPLTRARLLDLGAKVKPVYGDPALLAPLYHWPDVPKTHEIGVVVRLSGHKWKTSNVGPGVDRKS